ncbi:hypothetical protein [Angustibacter luteus]|uniref:Uncharacterized protein n=1 Tax=Angustibacter luteus TaxID=658456 RepID=A0ABW1JFU5_9ACTN
MIDQALSVAIAPVTERRALRTLLAQGLTLPLFGAAAAVLGLWVAFGAPREEGITAVGLLGAGVAGVGVYVLWKAGAPITSVSRRIWRARRPYCALHLDQSGITVDDGLEVLRLPWPAVSRIALVNAPSNPVRLLVLQPRADAPTELLVEALPVLPVASWVATGWSRPSQPLLISESALRAAVWEYSGRTVQLELGPL